MKEYIFSYRFGSSEWGITIHAANAVEAKEKIKAVGRARFEGELMAKVPAILPGSAWIVRSLVWWKNKKVNNTGGDNG